MDDLLLGEQLVAIECDGSDLVLRSFRDREVQNEVVGLGIFEAGLLELHVDVALVRVELPELVLVFLEDVVLETSGPGDPGEHPPTPSLDHLAQLALLERRSVFEEHVLDLDLRRFLHLEGDDTPAERLGDARLVVDGGPLKTGLLVHLENGLGIIEELPLIHGLTTLGGQFLAQLRGGVLLVSGEADFGDQGPTLHHVGEGVFLGHSGAIRGQFRGRDVFSDPDVEEVRRPVEVLDVVIDGEPTVGLPLFHPDVGPDEFFADGGRPDVLDDDLSDDRRFLGGRQLEAGHENGTQPQAAVLGEFHQRLIFGVDLRRTLEPCEALKEGQSDVPSGAIALLGDEEIDRMGLHRLSCVGEFLFLFGRLVEQPDDIGILLDGTGFTQIRQTGFAILVLLEFAVELGQHDDRHVQLLGQSLHTVGDVGDFLLAVVLGLLGVRMHQLEVVDDDELDLVLLPHPSGPGPELENGKPRRVIDVERALGHLGGGSGEFLKILLGHETFSDRPGIDPSQRA